MQSVTAGLRLRLEVDPEQQAKMKERIAENYNPRQANQARPNNHAHPSNKMVDTVLNYLAKKQRRPYPTQRRGEDGALQSRPPRVGNTAA